MEFSDNLIINIEDDDRNSFGDNRVELNEFNNLNISNNNDNNGKKIEMNVL